MSEALPLIDRIAARLERLAEMDMAAAEKAHAKLMAAETPEETVSLSRVYQRASRTLRQTLMLQMKYAKEEDAFADEIVWTGGHPSSRSEAEHARQIDRRIDELQDAVGRVASAAHPEAPKLQRDALDRLDADLDRWLLRGGFLLETLHEQVVEACKRLDLPPELAQRWRDLPPPAETFDPASVEAPVPHTDTG